MCFWPGKLNRNTWNTLYTSVILFWKHCGCRVFRCFYFVTRTGCSVSLLTVEQAAQTDNRWAGVHDRNAASEAPQWGLNTRWEESNSQVSVFITALCHSRLFYIFIFTPTRGSFIPQPLTERVFIFYFTCLPSILLFANGDFLLNPLRLCYRWRVSEEKWQEILKKKP